MIAPTADAIRKLSMQRQFPLCQELDVAPASAATQRASEAVARLANPRPPHPAQPNPAPDGPDLPERNPDEDPAEEDGDSEPHRPGRESLLLHH